MLRSRTTKILPTLITVNEFWVSRCLNDYVDMRIHMRPKYIGLICILGLLHITKKTKKIFFLMKNDFRFELNSRFIMKFF